MFLRRARPDLSQDERSDVRSRVVVELASTTTLATPTTLTTLATLATLDRISLRTQEATFTKIRRSQRTAQEAPVFQPGEEWAYLVSGQGWERHLCLHVY